MSTPSDYDKAKAHGLNLLSKMEPQEIRTNQDKLLESAKRREKAIYR